MDEEVAAKFDIKTLVVIIRCHNAGSTVIIVILIVLQVLPVVVDKISPTRVAWK